MGAFDTPTGTHIDLHVHVGEKGDYYTIDDAQPQFERTPAVAEDGRPSPG